MINEIREEKQMTESGRNDIRRNLAEGKGYVTETAEYACV